MIDHSRIFTSLVLASALASCGGDPTPTQPGGDGNGAQMTRQIQPYPSFKEDVQEIFVRNGCASSGCHADGQGGFTLSPDDAANYVNIVNVRSESERAFRLVEPFDATNSYMIIRMEGRQAVGPSMPGGAPVDSVDLTNFKNWINNGAENN